MNICYEGVELREKEKKKKAPIMNVKVSVSPSSAGGKLTGWDLDDKLNFICMFSFKYGIFIRLWLDELLQVVCLSG